MKRKKTTSKSTSKRAANTHISHANVSTLVTEKTSRRKNNTNKKGVLKSRSKHTRLTLFKKSSNSSSIHGLSPIRVLLWRSTMFWWRHKRHYLWLSLIYFVCSALLAQGTQELSITDIKESVANETGGEGIAHLAATAGVALSAGTNDSSASAYQFILFIIFSLATVWMTRRLTSAQKFRLRDTLYRSMYPFVPFVMIIVLVVLQTIPFFIGGLILAS